MIVVIPVCHKDKESALRNLAWCRELDGHAPFHCVVSSEVSYQSQDIEEAARGYFKSVASFHYHAYPRFKNQAWPRPQNWAWRALAIHASRAFHEPWLWWEQDAIPLKPAWLEKLQAAYIEGRKPFLGSVGAGEPKHLTGVAVYPVEWQRFAPQSMIYSEALPFDSCGSWRVMQNATVSPLIQHVWTLADGGTQGPAPTFTTALDFRRLSPDAVLFHRCKDGSLIEMLRKKGAPEPKPTRIPKRRMRRRGECQPTPTKKSINALKAIAQKLIPVSTPLTDLTVVITNFKRPDLLWDAFKSCLCAKVENIVVSSSGATDDVKAVHKKILSWRPDTKIVSEDGDSGSNDSWIRGVEAARTEWVHILHDDDLLLPDFRCLSKHLGSADFICWDSTFHGAQRGLCEIFRGLTHGLHDTPDIMPLLMCKRLSPSPVAGCFRRKHLLNVLRACRSLGPEYKSGNLLIGNDYLIWILAARRFKTFLYLETPLTSYGAHEGSATFASVKANDGKLMDIYDRVRTLAASGSLDDFRAPLELPTVTAVVIDSFHPLRSLRTLRRAQRSIQFGDSVIVTTPAAAQHIQGIRTIDALATDARVDRERYMISRITEAFSTPFCLNMEWDTGVKNLDAWDDDWFNYDFIGAPWSYPRIFHGRYHVTPERCVGNTGFSLISKKLADALTMMPAPSDAEALVSDVYMSIELRPALEKLGIRFAPESVAARFSCEARKYSGQFGWHGEITARMNNFQY